MADEDLVDRLRRGDTDAFDEIYRRHSARLLAYLRRMIRDDDRAQDLLQDVFLRLIEHGDSIDADRPFARWLYAVAHNVCCSELRHRRVRHEASRAVGEELRHRADLGRPPAPDQRLDHDRFVNALEAALDRITPQHRSVFLLRHQQSWPIADIAAAVGCPVGTVKSRLFHAVRELAAQLGTFHPEDADHSPDPTGPTS